jgi:hypothetical protein
MIFLIAQDLQMIELYEHQKLAIEKLHTGSILVGGVGTGKSLTSLSYFFTKVCNGSIDPYLKPDKVCDLYIITTARKRDTKEWDLECSHFYFDECGINVIVDSWNNIVKYKDVKKQFFIFDEQRVVGSGTWSKMFIKIAKANKWILLSATPGDVWNDYVPVFIANGYFKNRTEFNNKHVVWKPFTPYPIIQNYIHTDELERYRDEIIVYMKFTTIAEKIEIVVECDYDKELYKDILKNSWDPWKDDMINDAAGMSQCLRKVTNSDPSRIRETAEIVKKRIRAIIFYNFNYELELLKKMCVDNKFIFSEWNGHKHQPIPDSQSWVYLVQYMAGAEGWNCIQTDTIIFYSQNHSYKLTTQAAGRIDRMNTPFSKLYFYKLTSKANIDKAITQCLLNKKDFNENKYSE